MKQISVEAKGTVGIILDLNRLQGKFDQLTDARQARGKIYPTYLFPTGSPGYLLAKKPKLARELVS